MINRYEDGEKQGLWIESEGAGEWAGHYERGRKEGSWSYFEGRVLRKTVRYRNGLKDGPGYSFGPGGNLTLALEFEGDRVHGRVRFFSSDGQHIATYRYIYDKLDGVEYYLLHDESPPKDKTFFPDF